MNRRDFLCRSSAYAVAAALFKSKLLGQGAPAAVTTTPPPARLVGAGFTQFTRLRRNVGIFTGRGGTIGWLAASDGLAIVDTQFPDSAAICLAGLPGRGDRKIDVVLNTHHHA